MKPPSWHIPLYVLSVALLVNAFSSGVRSRVYGEAESAAKLLKLDGDLVLNGKLIVGKNFTLSASDDGGATIQCASVRIDGALDAGQLSATSARFTEAVHAGGELSAASARITGTATCDALHANNVAVAKNLAVGEAAYIQNIALRELKTLIDDLEKHKVRPVGETIERLLKILRAMESASGPEAEREE